MRICRNDDIVWALMKTLNNNLAKNFPTWSTYNYILADKKPTITHCLLPIIQGTPADWSNLYLAIASSAKLIVNIGQNSKTVISLDLQLYMKCIHLKSIGNINQNFIFHMGRLCCFLHDENFSENNQCKWFQYESFHSRYLWPHHSRTNKSGKHVYRSFEGYLLYVCL